MRLLGTRLVYPLLTRRSIAASRGLPFRSTTQVAAASSPASTSRWNLLRPYQHDCVEAVLAAFAKGQRRVAISMPTGSGKTRIFSAIMPLLPAPRRGADKVLVLVNRTELLEQAVRALNETQAHLIVGMEAGPRRADVAACDVIVASVSSLGRESQAARRHRFDPADFKLIVIDEAHHTPAIVYQRILTHFGVGVKEETRLSDAATSTSASSLSMDTNSQALSPSSPPPRTAASQICVLGCTATLLRHDGIALNYYEDIVFQRTLEDMVSKKFLVPPTARKVDINVDLSDVRVLRGVGDYATDDLSIKLSDPLHTAAVVEQWKRLAWDAGRRSTLVFCVDVGHMMALEAKFRGAGVDARSVCGATPARERTQTLADFTRGDVPVLLNVAVLTEGTDLPCVDCIIFVRPTRSQGLFQQMLGRGLRLHPGKTDCLCVDLVGNFDRLSLEGEPTLSGLSMAAAAAAVGKALLKEAKRKERRSQSILAHAIENDLLTDNDAELTAEEKELPLAEGNAIATEADSTDAAATTTRRNELPSEEMTHAVQQWKTVRRGRRHDRVLCSLSFSVVALLLSMCIFVACPRCKYLYLWCTLQLFRLLLSLYTCSAV